MALELFCEGYHACCSPTISFPHILIRFFRIRASSVSKMQTRSRTSSIDARVTLIEAVPSVHAKSVLSSPLKRSTSTTSPSTPQSKKRKSEAEDLLDSSPSTSRSTSKSPRKPKPIRLELDKPHPAPKRWEETLDVLTKQSVYSFSSVVSG